MPFFAHIFTWLMMKIVVRYPRSSIGVMASLTLTATVALALSDARSDDFWWVLVGFLWTFVAFLAYYAYTRTVFNRRVASTSLDELEPLLWGHLLKPTVGRSSWHAVAADRAGLSVWKVKDHNLSGMRSLLTELRSPASLDSPDLQVQWQQVIAIESTPPLVKIKYLTESDSEKTFKFQSLHDGESLVRSLDSAGWSIDDGPPPPRLSRDGTLIDPNSGNKLRRSRKTIKAVPVTPMSF